MKVVHFIVHSIISVTMSKIAYKYFEGEPHRAQLLTFVYLCCERDRELYQLMFNDEIMGMYLALTIYFLGVAHKPKMAAFTLTLGLSMKAGVMLLIPSFLGGIQYVFGTKTLIASLVIIVAF